MADPPAHGRLRSPVADLFAPRRVRAARPRIRAVAAELLDALGAGDPVDLVASYTAILPLRVLCDLLGYPCEEQRTLVPDLLRLARAAADGDPAGADLSVSIRLRLGELAAAKAPGDDALSALIAARDAGTVDDGELEATVLLLISAGHEAPADLIASTVLALLRDPGLADALRADPSGIPEVIEETLRHQAPSPHSTGRVAREAVVLGGVEIPAGGLVLDNIAAAYSDPSRHEDPAAFCPARERQGHLSFGHGAHFGLGAPLARAEAAIAVAAILERYRGIEPGEDLDALPWKPGLQMHGPRRLRVTLRPRG
ncbi:MAG TPA: cytochrome P450 [Phytomonospora sp.]